MTPLPLHVDWRACIEDIRHAGRFSSLKSVARSAKLPVQTLYQLNAGRKDDCCYRTGVPIINLHLQLLPGEPIPERRK